MSQSLTLLCSLAVALVAPSPVAAKEGPCPGCTAVFYQGLNGSDCYRIPSIIKTSSFPPHTVTPPPTHTHTHMHTPALARAHTYTDRQHHATFISGIDELTLLQPLGFGIVTSECACTYFYAHIQRRSCFA